jgi:hypothetical protein
MTKINRLNDTELKKLREYRFSRSTNNCPECPLSSHNNGANISCGEYVNLDLQGCRNIIDRAIAIEMEARKKDKMKEKQLLTESELQKKLQKYCDVINKIEGLNAHLKIAGEVIIISIFDGDDVVESAFYPFKPAVQPPPYGHGVWCYSGGKIFPYVSFGEIVDGRLKCHHPSCNKAWAIEHNTHLYLDDWCSMTDSNYHSYGWRHEWTEKADG